MLIELIFSRESRSTDFHFLKQLLENAKGSRFNNPSDISFQNYDQVVNIFNNSDYIDLVITTDNLLVGEKVVNDVFINLGLNLGVLELLFFFDLMDLGEPDFKEGIDYLKTWAEQYLNQYHFQSLLCRLDNGNENEYYFDKNGFGPLYQINN